MGLRIGGRILGSPTPQVRQPDEAKKILRGNGSNPNSVPHKNANPDNITRKADKIQINLGFSQNRSSYQIKHNHKQQQPQKNTNMPDAGAALHSPSAELMKLVDVDHMSDFDQVVGFLSKNMDKVIAEVHGFDKLIIDNKKTQLNCPPAPETGDSHGSLLIKTLSEAQDKNGVTLKREFKVHDLGVDAEDAKLHKVEIREDVVGAPTTPGGPPVFSEKIRVERLARA